MLGYLAKMNNIICIDNILIVISPIQKMEENIFIYTSHMIEIHFINNSLAHFFLLLIIS